ncbi:MAG: cyclic lactone autoinducer peptide [Eubacterium sp.]
MKKIKEKLSEAVAEMAVQVTSEVTNSACIFLMYQPELPEGAEELYK